MKQLAFFFVLLTGLCLWVGYSQGAATVSPFPLVQPTAAPDFSFTSENDGKAFLLKDKTGKYIVLHFWATWCLPCLEELPGLAALEKEFPPETLEVIAIPTNLRDVGSVKKFYSEKNIIGPSVHLDSERSAMKVFSLNSLPVTLLIDPAGQIVGRIDAPVKWQDEGIRDFFRQQVSQGR